MALTHLIQALPLPSEPSSNLREHLIQRHIAHFNEQLAAITQLSDEAAQIQALESLLQKHRDIIAGTFLDYTASPFSPVTQRCIAIAEFLAQKINQQKDAHRLVTPIELLYPGFNFFTDSEQFPQLAAERFEEISSKETTAHASFCRTTLKEYQELQKKITELEKIETRTDEQAALLQQLVIKQHEIKKSKPYKNYARIQRKLDHNTRLKSLIAAGTHDEMTSRGVLPKIKTQDILASHILSTDRQHLIPVRAFVQNPPVHVYDPEQIHEPLTQDEHARLEKFNAKTSI